jgi:protein arginine kinase
MMIGQGSQIAMCRVVFNVMHNPKGWPVDLETLARSVSEWLKGTGPEADIIVSSRIRLARNLAKFPFLSRADEGIRAEIENQVKDRLLGIKKFGPITYFPIDGMAQLDRQMFVERQLISRELSEAKGARGVAISEEQNLSIMVNEEDHLRIQVLRSGYELDACWKQISQLDDELESQVTYAFHEHLGYLTACPTNVGTGIRASVMLHLPALVLTKEIQKFFQAMHKMNLTVRGMYGEGSQAMGDFYQVSNQTTLGRSEEDIVNTIKTVIPKILDYERNARARLMNDNRRGVHDQVSRAYGILKTAQTISSEETMQLLSNVRMGVNLGLIDDLEIPQINELFIFTQPAHLQKIRKERMESAERNVARAAYLRSKLIQPDEMN